MDTASRENNSTSTPSGEAKRKRLGVLIGGAGLIGGTLAHYFKTQTEEEIEIYSKNYRHFGEFRDWFFQEFESVVCKAVQEHQFGRSFNLMDDKEMMAFREFPEREKCKEVYTKAAVKVAEILSRAEK